MSLPLGGIQGVSWQGALIPQPIRLCTPIDPAWGPKEVRIDIPWTQQPYSASNSNRNVGVSVNLANQQVKTPLEAVRFVKIDNSFNDVPVYLQFADTLDAVTCPANAVVGIPVMSNVLDFKIYGTGFFTGRAPVTSIFLSNAPQDAYYIPGTGAYRVNGGLTDIRAFTQNAGANITAMDYGQVLGARLLVLMFGGERAAAGAFPISGVAFDTTAATIVAPAIASSVFTGCAYARVDAGATGSVNITSTNSLNGLFASLYALYDCSQFTPLGTDFDVDVSLFERCVVTVPTIPGSFSTFIGADNSTVPAYGSGPPFDATISNGTTGVASAHFSADIPANISSFMSSCWAASAATFI